VNINCVYTDRQQEIACGTFVPVTMRRPVDALYHELMALIEGGAAPAPKSVTRIGDCLAPGTIAAAVYAGHRYAREFGEPPSQGVPFRRELPALAGN
jgi:dimethylamine/trimethylamine dehydrogenase